MRNDDRLVASGVDIDGLLGRLTAHAFWRIRSLCWRGVGSDGVLPNGESPESIVQTAFEKLLNGATWAEDRDVAIVLRGIVDYQIANLVRSWENRHFSYPQRLPEEGVGFFDLVPDDELSPLDLTIHAEDDDRALEILEALGEGTAEYRIASAIFNGARKRADIIADAEVSTSEYEATKKRLRNFLEKSFIKEFRQEGAPGKHNKVKVKP